LTVYWRFLPDSLAQGSRPSYGRRRDRSPRRRSRTVLETFASHGSSAHGLLSSVPLREAFLSWRLGQCSGRVRALRARSSVRPKTPAIRPVLFHCLDLPSVPASRQPIPVITPGLSFLRHPSPQWLVVGCLLLREPLKVAPFRMSICRDVRVVLYTGYLTSGVTYAEGT